MKRNTLLLWIVIPLVLCGICVMVTGQVINRVNAWVDANAAPSLSPSISGNCELEAIKPVPADGTAITLANAAALAPIAQWGTGLLFDVTWSPQSEWIALARSSGVYLYAADTFTLHKVLPHPNAARLIFSQDGATLASQDTNGKVYLWNVETGERSYQKTVDGILQGDFFGANGQFTYIASVGEGSTYQSLRTLGTGERINQFPIPIYIIQSIEMFGHHIGGDNFAVGADDQTFAIEKEGSVTVWDMASGSERYTITQEDELEWAVTALAFSPDMQQLAIARYNQTIEIRHATDGELIRTIEWGVPEVETRFAPTRLLFSPDSTLLAGAGDVDEPTILWDTAEGEVQYVLAGHLLDVVAFSPDNRYIAVGNPSHNLIIQSLERGSPVATIEGSSAIYSLALHPTQNLIAYGTGGIVQLASFTDGSAEPRCRLMMDRSVTALEFDPSGQYLRLHPDNYNAFLWKMGEEESVREIPASQDRVLRFHPDGETFYVAGYRTEISTQPIGAAERATLHAPIYIQDFAFRPHTEGREMVLWNREAMAIVESENMGTLLQRRYASDLTSVQFSPTGTTIAIADETELTLTDIASEQLLWQLPMGNITHMAFSHDGSWVAAAHENGHLYLLNAMDGTTLSEQPAHNDKITGVVISTDDRFIFTSGTDGTLAVWGIP